jgi:transcriptional regulator with XRE-family HTH domain
MRLRLKMEILKTYGTQADFARACGKSDHWISQIVKGRREPTKADRDVLESHLPGFNDDLLSPESERR